jgi:hypothetical protein
MMTTMDVKRRRKKETSGSHEAFDFRLNKRAFGWLHI